MNKVRFGFACVSALLLAGPACAQAPEPLSIVVFSPPSLGAFLPPVIKAQKLDEKHGLAIKFEERTPDAYTAQFNSGEFKLGGSALADDGRSRRHPRRQGDVSVQPVRLLGRGRDVAARGQDAEGSRRQGRRRGQGHHQLGDVRLVRPPARRRYFEIPGGQYRDPRPDRLRAGRSRRRRAALGARLYDAADEEAGDAHHRSCDRRQLEEIRRQRQHSLSRRRRAYRLGGEEPETGSETLRRLQGSLRLGHRQSRRGGESDPSQGHARRPQGHRRTHSRQ